MIKALLHILPLDFQPGAKHFRDAARRLTEHYGVHRKKKFTRESVRNKFDDLKKNAPLSNNKNSRADGLEKYPLHPERDTREANLNNLIHDYENPHDLNDQVRKLGEDSTEHRARITELEGQLTAFQTQYNNSQNQLAQLQIQYNNSQAQVAQLQTQLTNSQNQLTAMQTQHAVVPVQQLNNPITMQAFHGKINHLGNFLQTRLSELETIQRRILNEQRGLAVGMRRQMASGNMVIMQAPAFSNQQLAPAPIVPQLESVSSTESENVRRFRDYEMEEMMAQLREENDNAAPAIVQPQTSAPAGHGTKRRR